MSGYKFKAINKDLGKALHRYDMISDNDKILVGLSGGKDSMTLMWFLNERLARIPISYELYPVFIDPGFEGSFSDSLSEYCQKTGYRLRIEYTDYGVISHSSENRENPCFLCSRLRRKRLFEIADEIGCKKIALGHNKDDLIETMFLNMFYAGEISTMKPMQSLFSGKLDIIRPLAFVDEDLIRRFANEMQFPKFENTCPSNHNSKRAEVKELLKKLNRGNRKIKGNIFRAMQNVRADYLLN